MLERCLETVLELILNQRLGHRNTKLIEHLSSYAHVVHATVKQVISRRSKNENVFKMSKDEKVHVQSVQKFCFSLSNMQICGFLLPPSSWLLNSLLSGKSENSTY